MKTRLALIQILTGCLLLIGSITADAGLGGRIELYSDAALSRCTLTDTSPGTAEIYVLHRMSERTIASASMARRDNSATDSTSSFLIRFVR